jgi:hypothetical protein
MGMEGVSIILAPDLNQSLLKPSHHVIKSSKLEVVNYDANQGIESPSPRSNDDSNRFGPAGISLPHDICRSRSVDPNLHISTLTWILQNENGSSATREHSTPPPCVVRLRGFIGWVHATLTISTLPVRGCPFS